MSGFFSTTHSGGGCLYTSESTVYPGFCCIETITPSDGGRCYLTHADVSGLVTHIEHTVYLARRAQDRFSGQDVVWPRGCYVLHNPVGVYCRGMNGYILVIREDNNARTPEYRHVYYILVNVRDSVEGEGTLRDAVYVHHDVFQGLASFLKQLTLGSKPPTFSITMRRKKFEQNTSNPL